MEAISGRQFQPCLASTADKQRHAEQVAILYRNAPFTYAVTILCACMLSWIQSPVVSTETLCIWLFGVLLLTVIRSRLVYCYFRIQPDLDAASRWGRYYLIGTALSGILWGSVALFMFPAESTAHQIVIALVLAGMSASAVPMLSSIREDFWVYMLPTLLPLVVRLLTSGNELTAILGVMAIIFMAGLLISAHRMNRSIINSLSLRYENQALFEYLERDKAETDHLNAILQSEIAERTRTEERLRAREQQLRSLTDELEQRAEKRTKELRMEIEERMRVVNNLRQRSRALEQSGSAVLIVNHDNVIEYANPRFIEMTGYGSDELLEHQTTLLDCTASEDRLSQKLSEVLNEGIDWRGELRIRKKSGESYWSLLSISPIQEEDGKTSHIVAVGEDLTQFKVTQAQMEQLAYYDALTGLANRRLFNDRLEQALKTSKREKASLALLHIDVDHFKSINDTLGHDAGDIVLQTIARRLVACVRQQDTVARLGGDEFVVLLVVIDKPMDAGQVARKILTKLRAPVRLPTQEVVVTSSLGIAIAPEDGSEASRLMKHVDLALYCAKQNGRNTCRFFQDTSRLAT